MYKLCHMLLITATFAKLQMTLWPHLLLKLRRIFHHKQISMEVAVVILRLVLITHN